MSVLEPVRSDPFEPSQPRGATPLPDSPDRPGRGLRLEPGVGRRPLGRSGVVVGLVVLAVGRGPRPCAGPGGDRRHRGELAGPHHPCTAVPSSGTLHHGVRGGHPAGGPDPRSRPLPDRLGGFDQTAAHLLLHGRNPYASSMSSAARLLADPRGMWTYTATGGHVVQFSYPAGSFLIDLPGLVLASTTLSSTGRSCPLVAHRRPALRAAPEDRAVAGAPRAAPPDLRQRFQLGRHRRRTAAVLGHGGVAVGPLRRRGRGDGPLERAGVPRPRLLVQAAGLVLRPVPPGRIVIEARRDGRRPGATAARYLALVAGTFAVLNAPFFLWDPGAWVRGTLTPLTQPLVANGRGWSPWRCTASRAGRTCALDAGELLRPGSRRGRVRPLVRHLKRIWPALVPVSFFFATRSLSTYLVDLFVVLVVAAVSVRPPPPTLRRPRCAAPPSWAPSRCQWPWWSALRWRSPRSRCTSRSWPSSPVRTRRCAP